MALILGLVLVVALAGSGLASAPAPPGNAYGAYGCCCPYSAWLGLCPLTPGAFMQGYPTVCVNEDGGFCYPGDEGIYPYRDMTPRQFAHAVGELLGVEFRNVGAMLDFFCGDDWDRWLLPGD
ncbi:MAG: hypothetical protein ACNA8N_12330 [Trueperaceae bacterium]